MKNIINLNPEKITGKQAHKHVTDAVKSRNKTIGGHFTKNDFCMVSQLSRAQLNRYRLNEKPGIEGVYKLARGLKAWGYEVNIIIG